ncbi:MAG: FHA domain-containing protein, partial [Pirellulaceae bacterium]
MFTYLTLLNGARAGFSFILLDEGENRIGRGLDCHVVLDDPLSSRVHAIIERRDGSWFIRDAASRNGTFVNGQKADEAQLIDGCVVKTGTTEFVFSQSDTQPL